MNRSTIYRGRRLPSIHRSENFCGYWRRQVTSAAWAETLGACVGLAYVWRRDGEPVTTDYLETGRYEVNVGGVVCEATLHRRAPYDPEGLRVKM
jgi:glycine cleavage system aminomethyltransferase T